MTPPNLHDATLLSIAFRWGDLATIEARFQDAGACIVELTVVGASLLNCPRENPWGPSASINAINGPFAEKDGTSRLELEIQSGDVITIKGTSFEWRRATS